MNSFLIFSIVTLFWSLCYVQPETVQHTKCPTDTKKCDIHQVRINPCPDAREGKPCRMFRGTNGSIEFDFTPKFSGSQIGARVYWASWFDVPFLDMNSDGCLYTTCPMEAGKNYTLKYGILIKTWYPTGNYPIKWKVWNEQNEECCFMYFMKLR
ncbi:unnamed protein product [Bemisia tabaci]|uniref:MD-2-related lipid-recognition domain-containing protein n=1 Tax=Bemisia tabaci TaxID=7038 RepID=A0A9P0AIL8_BEMTA|nr:unnamed protein product [Bemisia tabaci]